MERTNNSTRCVYTMPSGLCQGQSPLHPKEHYLPAGFGNFKDDVRLKNFICYECQNRFSKFETVFLQNSTEAFFRNILGFSGRKSHKGKNIFVDPTFGLPPVTVKGLHPAFQQELLWHMTSPNEAFLIHQLVFKKSDGTLQHVPIRDGRLSQDIGHYGEEWKSWQLVVCIATQAQESELQAVLGPALDNMQDNATDLSEQAAVEGEMRAQITLPYVRAISKIAFHFVLARFHFTGFESEFDDLKRFIYLGSGANPTEIVEDPLSLQLASDNAFLRQWSHILTAEFDYSNFVARMQFYSGPRLKPFTWKVNLGKNPSRILTEQAQGFRFFYYDQPDSSGYVGGIEQLRVGPKMAGSDNLLARRIR
jgi:hypothetical protein